MKLIARAPMGNACRYARENGDPTRPTIMQIRFVNGG